MPSDLAVIPATFPASSLAALLGPVMGMSLFAVLTTLAVLVIGMTAQLREARLVRGLRRASADVRLLRADRPAAAVPAPANRAA